MKQITIFAGEKDEIEYNKNAAKETDKKEQTFNFRDFLNKYLKRDLPSFKAEKSIIINEIPNWELLKVYRAILNLEHNNFILIVNYKEEDLINKYI
jgi:hypothetical protein